MKRIVFENPRGNIKVTGARHAGSHGDRAQDDPRLAGATTPSAPTRSTPVEMVPQGDRLLIRTNQDRVPDNQRIADDLEVTVPRGHGGGSARPLRRLRSDRHRRRRGDSPATAADVRLARVGGNVRLDIGRSDLIRAMDVKGTVDLQGRGSDVELENIAGQVTITASYTGTLEFKNLAKPLQFEGSREHRTAARRRCRDASAWTWASSTHRTWWGRCGW